MTPSKGGKKTVIRLVPYGSGKEAYRLWTQAWVEANGIRVISGVGPSGSGKSVGLGSLVNPGLFKVGGTSRVGTRVTEAATLEGNGNVEKETSVINPVGFIFKRQDDVLADMKAMMEAEHKHGSLADVDDEAPTVKSMIEEMRDVDTKKLKLSVSVGFFSCNHLLNRMPEAQVRAIFDGTIERAVRGIEGKTRTDEGDIQSAIILSMVDTLYTQVYPEDPFVLNQVVRTPHLVMHGSEIQQMRIRNMEEYMRGYFGIEAVALYLPCHGGMIPSRGKEGGDPPSNPLHGVKGLSPSIIHYVTGLKGCPLLQLSVVWWDPPS